MSLQWSVLLLPVGESLYLQGRKWRRGGAAPVAGYMWDIVNWLISKLNNLLSPVTMFGLHPWVIQLSVCSEQRRSWELCTSHPGLQAWLCTLTSLFYKWVKQDLQDSCNHPHSSAAPFLDEGSRNSVSQCGFFFFFWENNSGLHNDLKLKIVQTDEREKAGATLTSGMS